ncbi:MAG TPA: WYL domain-containing protein, partial [Candidatus Limnocylindrales bacterium]
MRASRLVNVLLLLQTRGRMTADELARELEVSARTVQRDLEALSLAGVPVYVERGRYGGARLVEGYRTRLTGLTPDEAEALFLSGLPGAAAELGLGTVLAAAQLKVLAALPPELRARASRVRERFFLDAPGWFRTPDEQPHLAVLASAAWDDRRVRIRYRRGEEVMDRVIEPLGLVLKGGTWYAVASRDGEFRTYRVSRIEEAVPLDEHFDRPVGFDLAAHWESSAAAFEESFSRVPVTLRVAPQS